MQKVIFFDLDGTVLDTLQDIADCMNMAITELGYQPRTYAEYRKVIGNDAPNFVRKLLGDMPFEKRTSSSPPYVKSARNRLSSKQIVKLSPSSTFTLR